jgi:lipopolysaccharide transport system ATP-binding protein
MSRQYVRQRFDEIVDFSGVERFLDTPLKHYSSGMALRLGFAVAASLDPDILLVDEALAVGDIAFQQKCLTKMHGLATSGRTVLLVSHNLSTVSELCTRALLLKAGHLIQAGDTGSVLAYYQASVAQEAALPLIDRLDRGGNGVLRFTRLHTEGDGGNRVQSGKSLSIVLWYEAQAGVWLHNVVFAVKVCTAFGSPLLTCSTQFQGFQIDRLPPSGEITCTIPSLALAPGRYQLGLLCSVDGVHADDLQAAGFIQVLPSDFLATEQWPNGATDGPLMVRHEWRLPPTLWRKAQ